MKEITSEMRNQINGREDLEELAGRCVISLPFLSAIGSAKIERVSDDLFNKLQIGLRECKNTK